MSMKPWSEKRISRVERMLLRGRTLQEVADKYEVSRQRIHQIVKKRLPDLNIKQVGFEGQRKRAKQIARKKLEDKMERKTGRKTRDHTSNHARRCSLRFSRKKQNAKNKKWEWNLKITDMVFPKFCPILGIKLDYKTKVKSENSPSFDRVDTKRGYVKGNVIVCSWRANRIKNDGTSEEHAKIANFMRKHDKAQS